MIEVQKALISYQIRRYQCTNTGQLNTIIYRPFRGLKFASKAGN